MIDAKEAKQRLIAGNQKYIGAVTPHGDISADIRKDDVLTVKRSRRKVIFADLGAKSFYENTYEKLT